MTQPDDAFAEIARRVHSGEWGKAGAASVAHDPGCGCQAHPKKVKPRRSLKSVRREIRHLEKVAKRLEDRRR